MKPKRLPEPGRPIGIAEQKEILKDLQKLRMTWRESERSSEEKGKEASKIQKASTLLDIDLKKVIDRVRRRYHLSIPSKVLMADYDDKEGDLYLRFKESTKHTEGDPTDDRLIVVHRDEKDRIVALEILNLAEL